MVDPRVRCCFYTLFFFFNLSMYIHGGGCDDMSRSAFRPFYEFSQLCAVRLVRDTTNIHII